MHVVADANIIVSAFLWGGVPRQLLNAAEAQRIELFTSRPLIADAEDVLSREKFADQLKQTRCSAASLLARFAQLATLIVPSGVDAAELRDPDDEAVIACAIAADANLIVSGDRTCL